MKRFTCTQDKRSSERTNKRSRKHSHGSKEDHCCQAKITCDYCHKDITYTARILCAVCVEFDLCVECFSAGVELRGHKYWHGYRLIEDLRFSFTTPDWSANEEQLLLEGLELYGIGNWYDVANYVSSKDVQECIVHYEQFYLSSASWPEANFDEVVDSRLELDLESKPCKRSKCVNTRSRRQRRAATQGKNKKTQEPMPSAVLSLSGYMPRRNEFETEWDDACEKKIIDIEFTDSDTELEVEFKMQLLETYNKRLEKRHNVRKFVVENKLHDQILQTQQKRTRTPREEKLYTEMKRFLQVMSVEDYNEFIKGLVKQQELEDRVKELQEYRAKGFTSLPVEQLEKAPSPKEKMVKVKKPSSPTRSPPRSSSSFIPQSPSASVAAPVMVPVTPPGSPSYSLRSKVEKPSMAEERVTRSRSSLVHTRKQEECLQKVIVEQYQRAYDPNVFLHSSENAFAVAVI